MVDVELIAHLAQKYETAMAYAFRKCLGIVSEPRTFSPGTIVPVASVEDADIRECFNQRHGTQASLY